MIFVGFTLYSQELGGQSQALLPSVQKLPGEDHKFGCHWFAWVSVKVFLHSSWACSPWCRNFKYDETVQEYFVTTQDTVKVKLSEMEKWMKTSSAEDEARIAWFQLHFFRPSFFCLACLGSLFGAIGCHAWKPQADGSDDWNFRSRASSGAWQTRGHCSWLRGSAQRQSEGLYWFGPPEGEPSD